MTRIRASNILYVFAFSAFFIIYPFCYEKVQADLVHMSFRVGYIAFVVELITLGLFLSLLNFKDNINLLIFISVGMYIKTITIVIASYFILQPPFYLNIYDIYTGDVGISVSYANAMTFLILTYFIINSNKNIYVIFLLLFISILCELMLGARTFFIILAYSIIIYAWNNSKISIIFTICLLLAILVYFIGSIGLVDVTTYPIYERFLENGFNTPRVSLYEDYLNQILVNPIASPTPNPDLHYWFHNLFMDIHSSAGIILAIYFLAINMLLLRLIIKKKLWDLFFIFIIVMAILNTSVPLEGGEYAIFFYLIALHFTVLKAKKYEANEKIS